MSEYVVIFERADDGGWGAYLPDLPGVVALGDTREQVATRAAPFHLGRSPVHLRHGRSSNLYHKAHVPAHREQPADDAVAVRGVTDARRGMKSCTSPAPSGTRKRVMRMLASGR